MSETTETVRESREIPWCCSACEDAGHILAGHFACCRPEIPEGWAITTDCGYGDGGWRAVIEPVTIRAVVVSHGHERTVEVAIASGGHAVASGRVVVAPRPDRDYQPSDLMLGAKSDEHEWLPPTLRPHSYMRRQIEAAAVAVC